MGANVPIRASDLDALCLLAQERRIDLAVIGPEQPLAEGLADRLEACGVATFGPTSRAARIESSKAFAKDLMYRHSIPTAAYATFTRRIDARNYIESLSQPPVLKADGLAAGKGVFVCQSREDALGAVDLMMGDQGIFGPAGKTVVIEERLIGREVSAQAFTDGAVVSPMPFSCDYKRAFDGNEGPNTGGMGAYSPPGWLNEASATFIQSDITEATIRAMAGEGIRYRGVLYPGIIVTPAGPRVLEFNCRFGDPETQVVLPRLKSDLLEICWAVANDRLSDLSIEWSSEACVGVVLASGGYPDDYSIGFPISGLSSLEPDVMVFHAGTALSEDGAVMTSGGRVLTVVATGPTLTDARAKVYRNVQRVHFSRCHYRKDIAAPAEEARVD